MSFIKNYALDAEKENEVASALKGYKENNRTINHIVCESEFDAGPFFEDEVSDEDC